MENLNAEEVKRGLEHCTAKSYKCEECPYFYKSDGLKSSMEILMTDALALITSQEQRIKELGEENEKIGIENFNLICELSRIKEDTVRKMHSMLCEGRVSNDNVVIVANQVAKEMLEGE